MKGNAHQNYYVRYSITGTGVVKCISELYAITTRFGTN